MYPARIAVILLLLLLCTALPATAASIAPVRLTVTPADLPPQTTSAPPVPVGVLSVTSDPSGAVVMIDGTASGTTPFTIRTLAEGSHVILLSLAGYADVSEPVTITRDSRVEKKYTLVPLTTPVPDGLLSVSSDPAGATLIIDGEVRGTTPAVRLPVPAGSCTIVLKKTGYDDVSGTVRVLSGQLTEKSFTLSSPATTIPTTATAVPVTSIRIPATTAALTITPGVSDTPAAPPGRVMKPGLFTDIKFTRPVAVEPITVSVGSRKYQPVLTTDSPYFRTQLRTPAAALSNISIADVGLTLPPQTLLEVDKNTIFVNIKTAVSCSTSENCPPKPVWDDNAVYFIKAGDMYYNRSHFRWTSLEPEVTAFYQVSRYPFPADNARWQNQYIPGLVGSGPAKEIFVDKDGNHYFDLNFALAANHRGGDPPYYTGYVNLADAKNGKGTPLAVTKIPLTGAGFITKPFSFGSFSFSMPSGITGIPDGEPADSDLGRPNEGMLSVCTNCMELRDPTLFENALLAMDKTFYVRIVPIRKNGVAGVPSLPVTITAKRPQLCPAESQNTTINVVVRPPSVKVASFYLQAFIRNDWIHTDQNGKLVAPAHYLSVIEPADCANYDALPDMQKQVSQCYSYRALTGGGNPNYHFIIEPPENHWYDTVWDILSGLFMAFSTVTNAVSAAWSNIQAYVVKIVAVYVEVFTLGAIDCKNSDACKSILQTGLSIAMTYFGVPPTLPNFAELESMGTDYLARMAAEEIGAGEIYENIPDDAKHEITGRAGDIGEGLAGSLKSSTASVTATAAGSWYMPDPMYYEPHPAYVMVRVSNPNLQPTDAVMMKVRDTQGLYEETDPLHIPPLIPGESVVVPVTLRERFTDVYEPGCTRDSYTMTCDGSYSNCIPCYWNLWYYKAKTYSETKGPDQIIATLHVTKDGYTIPYLTPQSNGKKLDSEMIQTWDEQGTACKPTYEKTYLRYPVGWQMSQTPFSQNLMQVIWGKYTFTNGNTGMLVGN